MKIGLIGFTARGAALCRRLAEYFIEDGDECTAYVPERFLDAGCRNMRKRDEPLERWAGSMFKERRAMVFVGAAGIAVRAVAPFVGDKMTDPPVVVVDEAGRFSIPLLSGHVGGANELAARIADRIGAVPVITTATDVNGLFAVDVFAADNGLLLSDRQEAKRISACFLEGKNVGFFNDFPGRAVPRGCVREVCSHNIWITVRKPEAGVSAMKGTVEMYREQTAGQDGTGPAYITFPGFGESGTSQSGPCHTLRLVPKAVVAGVGCRRGTDIRCLEQRIMEGLEGQGIDPAAVKALATIDVKRDEQAIHLLAARYGWELRFYSADRLLKVDGIFEESVFVKQTVGVGNVCERACLAEGGRLLFGKQAGGGVTVAAAVEGVKLDIEKYM